MAERRHVSDWLVDRARSGDIGRWVCCVSTGMICVAGAAIIRTHVATAEDSREKIDKSLARVDRCEPQPLPAKPNGPSKVPRLTLPIEEGRLKPEPDPLLPEVYRKVAGAVVKIVSADRYSGSGFAMNTSAGPVVVTAAHIAQRKGLTVTSIQNKTAPATPICAISERDGSFLHPQDASTNAERRTDLAFLRLQAPLPIYPLMLAPGSVARGDWLHLLNYQDKARANAPKQYNGLVVATGQPYRIMTGLRRTASDDGRKAAAPVISPGASGGVVVNDAGDVVGVSTGGWDRESKKIYSEEELREKSGILLPKGAVNAWRLRPYPGLVQGGETIQVGLNAAAEILSAQRC